MFKTTICMWIGILFFSISALASQGTHHPMSKIRGIVKSGSDSPISYARVTLYQAGHGSHDEVQILGCAQANFKGRFEISFRSPKEPEILYLVAEGSEQMKQASVRFLSVLGKLSDITENVVINERTTIGSTWAMAQFIQRSHDNDDQSGIVSISGKTPGLEIAAITSKNLVNPTTGQIGNVLGNFPNGSFTSTMAEVNSLSNLLATCVKAKSSLPCRKLFSATQDNGETPQNTLDAAINIAHRPGKNVSKLFLLSQLNDTYEPALLKNQRPDAWTIAIKYIGNGHEFDGPGNMAIDQDGNVWVTNNYDINPPHCGGKQLLKLTPEGIDAPGAPYTGGGVNGMAYGISLDPNGNLWAGNFGFKGSNCPDSEAPPANSVSLFNPFGIPISPPSGFTHGPIDHPQGTVSDQSGNIWIANYGTQSQPGNTLTVYKNGSPRNSERLRIPHLRNPFDIAVNKNGDLWVSSFGNSKLIKIDLDEDVHPQSIKEYSGSGINHPLGVAVDSLGNLWSSSFENNRLPFDPDFDLNGQGGAIVQIGANGKINPNGPFHGGGLHGPWGIAIDGNDHVWISNFLGLSVTELCGARTEKCPKGFKTGDPISPPSGYTSDALMRLTGIAIDPAGNIWVPNNWQKIPDLANPGGDGMVVFVGVAKPVKTPLIGPVRGI